MHEYLNSILNSLMAGNLAVLQPTNIMRVSQEAVRIINQPQLTEYDVLIAQTIIMMSQIVYNNTDKSVLFLDDGIYDLLLEKYKKYDANFQVGSPVVSFAQNGELVVQNQITCPISYLKNAEEFKANSLFFNDLNRRPPIDPILFTPANIDRKAIPPVSKKNVTIPHMYPKLVGSLDKCKFTLNREAMEKGVFDDPNVMIFERDFLGKHLRMGLIDMVRPFELVAELKYDGVSVEADVTNKILSARSRGDANNDIAADLTPILKDYRFPYAPEIPENETFGMKFEAIMTYMNLDKMSTIKNKAYKNSRNGIIGLFGSADAANYKDLITLVPLATSIEGLDRVAEIEFMNKYYHNGEYLRYSILKGNYTEILFQVYKFVKEAEAMRDMLPFMYDGVVISYRDPRIISALGRENSINKYSVAIKFNPLVRQAIFTGYTYTVGQDGRVTPMIHYTPVEFNGTIHSKSSGHSYRRFRELNLAIGDVVQVEYTNDVMPYVTKPPITNNFVNPNPPVQFPFTCPFCGFLLEVSETGKTATCTNVACPERVVSKMANMMDKLNVKDFGEETFRTLGTRSLNELLNYTFDDVKCLGINNAAKLLQRIEEIKNTPIHDYKILGAIGFTGIAIETCKKILNKVYVLDFLHASDEELYAKLSTIRGIGDKIIRRILQERRFYAEDLKCITQLKSLIISYGMKDGITIRYTGCRPSDELTEFLTRHGCDARPNAGVTRNTDILVVPAIGFTSSKTNKIGPRTRVIDYNTFASNPGYFIQ